jgi:predicted SAM-dependent methyltransferase
MKLHLGCGPDVRPGWVNIDVERESYMYGDTQYIKFDLSCGYLPLVDMHEDPIIEVEMIYSSHFFEHLTDPQAFNLFRECISRLRPGGVLRLCLPDFRACAENYLSNNNFYFDGVNLDHLGFKPETRTLIDHMTYLVYQFGEHKSLWDFEKAKKVLTNLDMEFGTGIKGFSQVDLSQFDRRLDQDLELRRRYSFYLEAIR